MRDGTARKPISREEFLSEWLALMDQGPIRYLRSDTGAVDREYMDSLRETWDETGATVRPKAEPRPKAPVRPKRDYRQLGHDAVREIRCSKEKGTVLADRFGIGVSLVSKIKNRQRYENVPD